MRRKLKARPVEQKRRPRSIFVSLVIVFSIAGMLFLTINYRAFNSVNSETREFELLSSKIQGVTDENLRLQDEIHNLKTDSATVTREAQRLGIIGRSQPQLQKFSVPKK